MAELVGRHEDARARLAQDELDLLLAVEVHDRHRDGAEERDRPEQRAGLGPVGHLERDRLTGPDTRSEQTAGDTTRPIRRLGERAPPRPDVGAERHDVVGSVGEPGGQDRSQRLVGPGPVGAVPLGAERIVGAGCEVEAHVGARYRPAQKPGPAADPAEKACRRRRTGILFRKCRTPFRSRPTSPPSSRRSPRERSSPAPMRTRRRSDDSSTPTYAVMRRTGDLDPRVTDIVREAGLSNQAFYRHFRSKDELLVAVLADGQRRLVETLRQHMDKVGPGRAASARVGRGRAQPGSSTCRGSQHPSVRDQRAAPRRPVPHRVGRVPRRAARAAARRDRRGRRRPREHRARVPPRDGRDAGRARATRAADRHRCRARRARRARGRSNPNGGELADDRTGAADHRDRRAGRAARRAGDRPCRDARGSRRHVLRRLRRHDARRPDRQHRRRRRRPDLEPSRGRPRLVGDRDARRALGADRAATAPRRARARERLDVHARRSRRPSRCTASTHRGSRPSSGTRSARRW